MAVGILLSLAVGVNYGRSLSCPGLHASMGTAVKGGTSQLPLSVSRAV